jgi:hypothetical protein
MNSNSSFKQIAIPIVSSVLGALIVVLGSSALGLFRKTISDTQVREVAKNFINDESSRNVLLDKMKQAHEFKGEKGEPGVQGERGPPGKVLALVIVKEGKIESSSDGVSYDPNTGIVSFPNPENLKFVPLISDFGERDHDAYRTATHFLRNDFTAPNKFKVWRTSLDTGDRNMPPDSFAAIALGL